MSELKGRKAILVRNTKYGAMLTLLQYLMQFAIRTVMIYTIGVEYLGIGGLFANIIGCLGLVEMGMGAAISFSMYKPVAEHDTEKIKSLHRLYRNIYYTIAIIILSVGLCLIPVLPLLIEGGMPDGINMYVVYGIFLLNTIISYLTAHKRSLIIVNQRNDVESKLRITGILLLNLIQILVLLLAKNYYLYLIAMPICAAVEGILIVVWSKKLFPEINVKAAPIDKQTKKEIIKNITASSMHQLGGVLVLSTDNIIISAMLGLFVLGTYSNYNVIITCIASFITLITVTSQSSLGNLVATESPEYVYRRYNIFNFFMMWIVSFCTVCLICLFNPFVEIWTGGNNLLLNFGVVLLLCFNFYISNSLSLTNVLNVSAGLIWYSRWKPLIQGITNLVTSIILTYYLGLVGVFIGTFISYLIVPIWIEPYILYKHYFRRSVSSYWLKYLIYTLAMLIAGAVTYFVCSLLPSGGIGALILKFSVCAVVPNVILLACLFWMPEFKECVKWGVSIIKGLIKKGKTQETVAVSNNDNAVIVSSIDLDKDGIVDVEVAISTTSLDDSDINNESCDISNEADAESNQTLVDNIVTEKEEQ